jgi:L-rhamnose mutarotase
MYKYTFIMKIQKEHKTKTLLLHNYIFKDLQIMIHEGGFIKFVSNLFHIKDNIIMPFTGGTYNVRHAVNACKR